eukprot:TRINITY_DN6448_c1_g1_i1.p1 TRINITY_DN6448_c1_g1~~TRINITY_DN6448_c1_g1_i1.p1  ORF type:complete len:260 (-),score=59.27 TRINITY_DN6448_c1_g1_i1:320-1099(-)
MAATSLKSLHHPLFNLHHPFPPPDSPSTTITTFPSSLSPKPTTPPLSLSYKPNSIFSLSSSITTPTATTSQTLSFDLLNHHLSTQNFLLADEETRKLLISLAGDAAQARGYVFFSEVQFISDSDLRTIDELWLRHSGGKFGYSVQKRIWEKSKRDFTKFFMKVGWMRKLDTEMEQYNYRSFPSEFIWELSDETPEGHLPLTNALRGTQLLNNIFLHPAFESGEEGKGDGDDGNGEVGLKELRQGTKPMKKMSLKSDYSF